MGQNGHANARVMRKSKKTITVAKKTHTVKNIVLGGIHTRKVNYLSQTYEGRRHDKRIVDEENPSYPTDIGLYKERAWRCWGLSRDRDLLSLHVQVRIPTFEDVSQFPIQRPHAGL